MSAFSVVNMLANSMGVGVVALLDDLRIQLLALHPVILDGIFLRSQPSMRSATCAWPLSVPHSAQIPSVHVSAFHDIPC